MNELELNELNEQISYDEGKIYWVYNKDYSSKLWESLSKQGYQMTSNKGGLNHIKDSEGNYIVRSAIGRANALYELSKVMR